MPSMAQQQQDNRDNGACHYYRDSKAGFEAWNYNLIHNRACTASGKNNGHGTEDREPPTMVVTQGQDKQRYARIHKQGGVYEAGNPVQCPALQFNHQAPATSEREERTHYKHG